MNEVNRQVIAEFRANGGKVVSGRFAGTDLVLLTTTGAKSGAKRVKPLMYVKVSNQLVVFASKNAAPTHPDWYFNLVANPGVEVEIGAERYEARAVVASGEERERLWQGAVAQYPFLTELQGRTKRQIPIIVLERR